jgi:hypothetical protein
MSTIHGLTDATTPLTGNERIPLDQPDGDGGFLTRDATVADAAYYAEVTNSLKLGYWPERIDTRGAYFTTQAAGDPLSVWFAPTLESLAGYGTVIKNTGQLRALTRGTVSGGADRILQVEAEIEQVSIGAGEAPSIRLGMTSMKSDFTATSGAADAYSPLLATLTSGQVAVVRYRFGVTAPAAGVAWADGAAAVWLRPIVEANRKADNSGFETNSIARVRRLRVTDVTSQASSNWPTVTANYNAVAFDNLVVDPSAGAFTITLPGVSLKAGTTFRIKGNCLSHNVTVDGNGHTWAGFTGPLVLNLDYTDVTILFDGTNLRI